MRAGNWVHGAGVVLMVGLLAGCGATAGTTDAAPHDQASSSAMPTAHAMPTGRHTMPDGTVMDGKPSAMPSPAAQSTSRVQHGGQPSAAAMMACSDETRSAVQTTFNLAEPPRSMLAWSEPTLQCDYTLPGGQLRLTVADLDSAGPGRAWFDQLRARLHHAKTMRGMQSLGFPAFETAGGDVVFLKDHKTLWVDASKVTSSQLPAKFTRTDVAYQVAAAVVACWSE